MFLYLLVLHEFNNAFEKMKQTLTALVWILPFFSCQSQTGESRLVGGPCEGCEAVLEYGTQTLSSLDTLPKFQKTEPKLKIYGTVYESDGKTPAEDVIVYIYHTNRQGIYETRGYEKGWAQRHGFIRGWVKTGSDGKYAFYTFRPAAYPDGREPEHVHITVKEPDKNEYYLDEYVFDDDPLLTDAERRSLANRGGSGIVQLQLQSGMLTVERDLVLGLNIPNYPNLGKN